MLQYLDHRDWASWSSWPDVSHGEISHVLWVHQLKRFYRPGRVQQEPDDFSVPVHRIRPSATRPQPVSIVRSTVVGIPYVSVWYVFWIVHALFNGTDSCWSSIH